MNLQPDITEEIIVGGYLSGKGKMWLNGLKVTIDGKDIQHSKPYKRKIFPAEKDTVFNTIPVVIFPELSEQEVNNLELLGKIWGFLKYHHPFIAKGNCNWDYELLRMLPIYLKANDNKQRDRILLDWINKYGKIPTDETIRTTADNAFIKPDLSWAENDNISPDLKTLLKKIYQNRYQGNQYYVRIGNGTGGAVFLNEKPYSQMPYPDDGVRLLALYRYWNMIHYFFPYKYLTDKDWNTVLKEYIPDFIGAKNELEYELTVLRLIGEVCDTHAGLWKGGDKIDSLRGNRQAPFQVQFIENKLVITNFYIDSNFAERAGISTDLKIGDIITHIDGKSVTSIVDSIKRYYPASNEAARLRNIANNLLRSNEYTISINYISSNKIKQKKIILADRKDVLHKKRQKDITKCYKFLDGNIGYITLKSIKNEDIPIIKKEFMNTEGIVIDIRNYPSANTRMLVSNLISKPTAFVKWTVNTNNPGEFIFENGYEIPKSEKYYQGKVIVIVNEETQSAAEFAAMAFRTGDNTTIIGSTTAGADGNVSEILLPGGLKTWISGIGIYYPDGRETQRVGIVPDIEVKPTIKGIREGRDELLEKAIEIIKEEQKSKKVK
ncbi:hypothetical protein FACS1894155_10180 [Bacteroidia bacterium]|nr:hypothetical protein FACS1894155_10180 [Bacteroidia bacterium]